MSAWQGAVAVVVGAGGIVAGLAGLAVAVTRGLGALRRML